jgi:hypothetical protein
MWQVSDLIAEVRKRVAAEKAQTELCVHYYRIGYRLAFPLPLDRRPQDLPAGIRQISAYPWMTWLLWRLEERWRVLHAAWRHLGDAEAGSLLQAELCALATWSHFRGDDGNVSLITGHVAGVLAHLLADPSGWDGQRRQQVRATAATLLDRDLLPWFRQHWCSQEELTPARLHNIAVISLVRAAHLARVTEHLEAPLLEDRALTVLRTWWHFRLSQPPHTEGAAYDGYLMDHVTEWLQALPNQADLLAEGRRAFESLAAEWIHLSLPGQPAQSVPLGDVESEMPFWMTVLLRLYQSYQGQSPFDQGTWLLQHVAPASLPAAALAIALAGGDRSLAVQQPPRAGVQEVANAISLRTGWDLQHLLLVVGASGSPMSHLHNDGGHIILGWRGRFWITDPGYQQYRPGEERDYTVGASAHNAPVINGIAQTRRNLCLLSATENPEGEYHVALDLSACYDGLPEAAQVRRDLWLTQKSGQFSAIVRDTFADLEPGCEIRTQWLADGELAWSFQGEWARLSDGERTLWIGAFPGQIAARDLDRHPGSRGPLTLSHTSTLSTGSGVCWWIFQSGVAGDWQPPQISATDGEFHLIEASITGAPLFAAPG